MLKEIFSKILAWDNTSRTRYKAKNRLKLVIAHDRAGINPEMISKMREEIIEVVSRYLEIDIEEMDLSIESSDRITSLTANLPIKKVKRSEEG
jgi:cell division topological specificity factor